MMEKPLSSADLLRWWEGAESEPSDQVRALLLLRLARPEVSWEELAALSIGQRDRQLLLLRGHADANLPLFGECPQCRQALELSLCARDLLHTPSTHADTDFGKSVSYRLEYAGLSVDFRLPNSADLEAAGRAADVETARSCLFDRCVISATTPDGAKLAGSELSSEIQDAIEQRMEQLDPLAVIGMDMSCPGCSHAWKVRVDLSRIIATEQSTRARRLLVEVSTLARLYHWSEESILAMTPRRRQAYLELVQP
jgi:hypothetical protein